MEKTEGYPIISNSSPRSFVCGKEVIIILTDVILELTLQSIGREEEEEDGIIIAVVWRGEMKKVSNACC